VIKQITSVLTAVYPLCVYVGLAHFSPAILGLVLAALLILRLTPAAGRRFDVAGNHQILLPTLLLISYSLLIALSDSDLVLRFYPVLINLIMCWFFFTLTGRGANTDRKNRPCYRSEHQRTAKILYATLNHRLECISCT
jgi:uncharacterized membrane protein